MTANSTLKFGVTILAAGASKRMGKPKLLLPWGEATVLENLLRAWKALGASQAGLVWSSAALAVKSEFDRVQFPGSFAIENPKPDGDMWSSIICASRHGGWSTDLTHFTIVLGDQPHVGVGTLQKFFGAIDPCACAIWQPSFHGMARHPVVLHKDFWKKLASFGGPTLYSFLERHRGSVHLVPTADAAITRDIDTPTDYEELKP